MAASSAPEAYLGFTTGSTVPKKPRLVSKVTTTSKVPSQGAQPVRKIAGRPKADNAKITTSSWRQNTRNAKKLLEKEKNKGEPDTVTVPMQPVPKNESETSTKKAEIENIIENNISPEVFGILKVWFTNFLEKKFLIITYRL